MGSNEMSQNLPLPLNFKNSIYCPRKKTKQDVCCDSRTFEIIPYLWIDFRVSWATGKRSCMPTAQVRKRERGKQELCGWGLTTERCWLLLKCWLSAFSLGSSVAGWSAKWAPVWADSSSNLMSKNCVWLQKMNACMCCYAASTHNKAVTNLK